MLDRADITAILLLVAGLIVAAFFQEFDPNTLNSSGGFPAAVFFLVVTGPTYGYATYWAFSIRRALAVRLYRRQAFGIGVIILLTWSTLGTYVTLSSAPLPLYSAASTLTYYFLFLVLFYWIDASVIAARRSDPLLRDTLYWSKLRIPLWIFNIVGVGAMLLALAYAEITGNVTLLSEVTNGNFTNAVLSFLSNVAVLVTLPSGAIFLTAIAIRAKWDRTLRRHFAWFAFFAVFLFGILTPVANGAPSLIGPLIFLGGGYTLYKSAKSLVPLNRVSFFATE